MFVVPVIASLSSVALVSRTHGAYFPTLILSIIKTSDFIIQHTADERMSSFDIEFFVNIGHVLFYRGRADKQCITDFINVHAIYQAFEDFKFAVCEVILGFHGADQMLDDIDVII